LYNGAKGAFSYYEFEKAEAAILTKFISHSFKDDTLYYGVKNKIIEALAPLGNDKTLSKYSAMYLDKKTSNLQKLALLSNIPKIPAEKSVATYFELLENHPPDRIKDIPFTVLNPLKDSTIAFAKNAKYIIPLLQKDNYRDKLLSYFNNRTLDDTLFLGDYLKYKLDIVSHFKTDVTRYLDTITRNNHEYCNYSLMYDYLDVITTLNATTDEVRQGLDMLTSQLDSENWLHTKSIITSLQVGAPVKESVLRTALDTLYSRFEIMEGLITSGNLDKVPEAYLEPVEFSKLCLYNDIGDYYSYPNSIDLVGSFTENEKEYFVFSYEYLGEEEEEEEVEKYIAIMENLPVVLHDFKRHYGYYGEEVLEEDWETQGKQMLQKYLENE
jgi:hypothetical protein